MNKIDSVQCTTDYSRFKFRKDNREIIPGNLRQIEKSILSQNLLPAKPILVNQDFEVIDGQHRLLVAKKLKLPIYFVVSSDLHDSTLIDLNRAQRQWTMQNYMDFHVANGNEEYIKLKKFWEFSELQFHQVLALFDVICRRSKQENPFTAGQFHFPEDQFFYYELVKKVKIFIEYVKTLPITPKSFINSKSFFRAIRIFLTRDDIDFDRFMKKMQRYWTKLRPEGSKEDYVNFFEKVYNMGLLSAPRERKQNDTDQQYTIDHALQEKYE